MVKLLSFKIFGKEIGEIRRTIDKIREFKKNYGKNRLIYGERYNDLNYDEIKKKIEEIKNLFGEGDEYDSKK